MTGQDDPVPWASLPSTASAGEWEVKDSGGPSGPSGPSGARRARTLRRRRRTLRVLAALAAGLVIFVGAGLYWAWTQIDPGGHRGPAVSVVIPPGSSVDAISHRLAAAGVIHSATLFAFYVRLHGDSSRLLPGTYSLATNSPYGPVISALEAGPRIVTDELVVPPGFTIRQIAARVAALPGLGLSAQKFIDAATNGSVTSEFEPPGLDNLEGLVYPDTYQVRQGESETDILQELVSHFDAEAQAAGLPAAAARLGYSPYQVVEVASIVEKEAKLPGDRPNVASAIYNRLREGMHLGADSTQVYYLRLSDPTAVGTAAQDDQPSPYNTRLNPGLPPTAIGAPGPASLMAAINPPATTYIYWVEINPDGQLGFASDSAGFDQLRQQCRAAGLGC